MSDFVHEIRERRVLPALGVYVGGSWVLIEILDRLVERYFLSPYLTDIAFWGLYSLVPAVFLIAWTHGKPGKDRMTRAEKVGVPINLIATFGLLLTLFSDKDLGAAAELVTVSDEFGDQVSQYVARDSYRRRVMLFFWDNRTGDAAHDWRQYTATETLTQDLQQSPFVVASSPWNGGPYGAYARMKQAGFEDGLDVPRNLLREISEDYNRQHYIDGTIDRAGDEWVLTARVWDSGTGRLAGSVEERGHDFLATMDRVSLGVRDVLEVPSGGRATEDLALVDTYGESEAAMRAYIDGLNALLLDNDFDAADRHFDAALAEDPQFVLAWFQKGFLAINQGDVPRGQQALEQAQRLDYRLPSQDQAIVKANLYRLAGESDKLESFLRMQVRLYDNARSYRLLASVLLNSGRLDEAREAFDAAYERDSSDVGILLNLAVIDRAQGEPERAAERVREYLGIKPQDPDALIMLGDLLRETNDLEGAERAYTEAQFVRNDEVTPLVRLAQLASARGDTDEAWGLLEEATEAARGPSQVSAILAAEAWLKMRLGKIREGLGVLESKIEQDRQFMAPIGVAFSSSAEFVHAYLKIGRVDKAREVLNAVRGTLQPPMDQFLAFPEIHILAREGRFDEARAALDRGIAVIDQFQLDALRFQVDLALADIAYYEDQPAIEAEQWGACIRKLRDSVIGGMPELYSAIPSMMGAMADAQIRSGQLEAAQITIEEGFRYDSSDPYLWMARAKQQLAWGKPELAKASLAYTLAIWSDADPDFEDLVLARELEQRIDARLLAAD